MPLVIPLFNLWVFSLMKAFDTSQNPEISKLGKKKPTPKRKAKVIVKIQINDLLDDEQSYDLESGINSEEELSNLV